MVRAVVVSSAAGDTDEEGSAGPPTGYTVTDVQRRQRIAIWAHDERDLAARIWRVFCANSQNWVRLELDPETLELTTRGWIVRADQVVRRPLLIALRRV